MFSILPRVRGHERTMQVRKVMSSPVITATTDTTIREAAMRMRTHGVGSLPVLRDGRPIGLVTDRDIVTRALGATGFFRGPDTAITDIMSRHVITCLLDDDVAEAAALMGERQVRRLVVLSRDGVAVGVVSLGDLAEHASEELAGQVLGEVSEARAQDDPG